MHKLLFLSVGLLCCFSNVVFAQEAGVVINADAMVLIDDEQVFRYTGNVEVIQAGMTLRSEQADAYFSENNISELLKFIASGDRVLLTSPDQDVESDLVAYDFTTGTISFSGDVIMLANGTKIESDEMVVQTREAITAFRMDPASGRRLNFVGMPQAPTD